MNLLDALAGFAQGASQAFPDAVDVTQRLLSFKPRMESQKVHDDYLRALMKRMLEKDSQQSPLRQRSALVPMPDNQLRDLLSPVQSPRIMTRESLNFLKPPAYRRQGRSASLDFLRPRVI